jgi:hypothetical protein
MAQGKQSQIAKNDRAHVKFHNHIGRSKFTPCNRKQSLLFFVRKTIQEQISRVNLVYLPHVTEMLARRMDTQFHLVSVSGWGPP